MPARPLVSIVDDDESVRESMPDLLRELGFSVQAFSSGEGFLASEFVDLTRCLILDIAMPDMTGLELQLELARRQKKIPIIFMTAQTDDAARRSVVQRGAVACLFKPFTEADLQNALDGALKTSSSNDPSGADKP